MITNILCPTAINARDFPLYLTSRRYCAARYVSLVWVAAHAACTNATRKCLFPFLVFRLTHDCLDTLPPNSINVGLRESDSSDVIKTVSPNRRKLELNFRVLR